MQRSSSGDQAGMEGLFGDMWADLEVPTSPPLHESPPSASPSPQTTATTSPSYTSSTSPQDTPTNSGSSTPEHTAEEKSRSPSFYVQQHEYTTSSQSTYSSNMSYTPPFLSAATDITKKRKPTPTGGIEFQDKPNTPVAWGDYSYAPKAYPVHDALSFHSVTEHIDVIVQNVNSNSCYSPSDGAFICYRQNQFKVLCLFRGPPPDSMCVNDEGVPRRVQEVCAKLYAVKEVAGVLGDEMRVGLHHVGKKRLKSAKMEVDVTPFVKGKISSRIFNSKNRIP